ncbi:hypothetical protein yc1106_02781 [Curvularia clavata]|uniref:Uncharacterized protein n=1 Tax=Curvularia clavata TaxID=95742 RepID=A0A9Q8Z3E6_CURCL|nr:hypothetical protein yc1106_02781 [Curvularia clavata]
MTELPKYFDRGPFQRSDVQDMLDEAQLDAGSRFADIPHVRDQLPEYLRFAFEECNRREVDPVDMLHRAMFAERAILDPYNKHRLGYAIMQFNAQVHELENAVDYKAEENVPETLAGFPLRAAVSRRGVSIQAPPIYQAEESAEAHQQHAPSPHVAPEAPRMDDAGQKTTNNSAAKARKPRELGSLNYNKLRDAPFPWLSFPPGNLTMAEITAFVPQAIKSVDVIDRFLYNGALSATLADMVNHYRTMPLGPIENNSIYRMMKGPMNVRAKTERIYQDWTVSKHATIRKPVGFDPTSVSVTSFRTPQKNSRQAAIAAQQPPPTILFRDMAEGVKTMPSGYDALDLTRCIQYCVENKDESWYYPQGFARLVSHLGGAVDVHGEHQDSAAIDRHTSGLNTRQPHNRDRRMQAKESVDSSVDEDTGSESDENTDYDDDSHDTIAVCIKDTKRKSTVSPDDMNFEDDKNDTIAIYVKDTDANNIISSNDMDVDKDDDNDTIAVCAKGMKRKKSISLEKTDKGSHSSSRFSKRRKKDAPSRGRKAALPDDIDSESESDVYVGPKNSKRAGVATRSSSRHRQFSGSYNVDEAFNSEIEDE